MENEENGKYELMLMLSSELGESETEKELEAVRAIITEHTGQVFQEDIWGIRDLAYRIKKEDKGFYAVLYLEISDPTQIAEMEKTFHIHQSILKFMLKKMDKRHVIKTLDELEAEYEEEEKEEEKEKEAKKEKSAPAKKVEKPAAVVEKKEKPEPKEEEKEEKEAKVESTPEPELEKEEEKEEEPLEVKEEEPAPEPEKVEEEPKKEAESKKKLEKLDEKLQRLIDSPDIDL